jgi:hypothetical protein
MRVAGTEIKVMGSRFSKLVLHSILVIVAGTVLAPVCRCQEVSVNWGAAAAPIYDEHGVGGDSVLANGCLVQFIVDSDQDGADHPDDNGRPSHGDVLLDSSSIGTGSFFKGKFSKNFSTSALDSGMGVYVRAWNGPSAGLSTHFGNSPLMVVPCGIAVTLDCTEDGPWATTEDFTGVETQEGEKREYGFELMRSFPNPFRDITVIWFSVPGSSRSQQSAATTICIYDASGRLVRVVLSEDRLPGVYRANWDCRSDQGSLVPSGTYFCRLDVGGKGQTGKLLFVR